MTMPNDHEHAVCGEVRAPKWATDDDPVGHLAVRLAARANAVEEETGEWIWRDIANAASEVLDERIAALTAEVERLRGALIETGRNAGALLTDDVTTDFLMYVPGEVKGRLERVRAETIEAAARVAEANAETSISLMRGLGASAHIEIRRHRAGIEIATAIRTEIRALAGEGAGPA